MLAALVMKVGSFSLELRQPESTPKAQEETMSMENLPRTDFISMALPSSAAEETVPTSFLVISSIRYFICFSFPDVKIGEKADLQEEKKTH